jgi:ABC-type nitrate/sulfonate/bicarbonate transport system permease component
MWCALKDYVRRWITIRDKPGFLESAVISGLCIGLVFFLWHLLTVGTPEERIVDPITLPALGDTFRSFHSLWFERELSRSALWSLGRVIGGFFLASIIGVPLGLAAGSFLRLNAFLKPFSIFGRNIPIAALIPLTLIWFGLGETQKVMFIFLSCVAFVFFDSVNSVQEVPNNYLDAAYTLGARFVPWTGVLRALVAGVGYAVIFLIAYYFLSARPAANDGEAMMAAWRTRGAIVTGTGSILGILLWFPILAFQPLYKVLLPLAMPGITNSLRLLFGLAFGYIMLAEVINAKFGLGALINLSQRQGPREHIYLVLILIALLAFGIDRGILAVQRWLFPYRQMGEH